MVWLSTAIFRPVEKAAAAKKAQAHAKDARKDREKAKASAKNSKKGNPKQTAKEKEKAKKAEANAKKDPRKAGESKRASAERRRKEEERRQAILAEQRRREQAAREARARKLAFEHGLRTETVTNISHDVTDGEDLCPSCRDKCWVMPDRSLKTGSDGQV